MTPLDELPERTAPGSCITCHGWTATGRVVAEIHGDSGAGATLVRCAGCTLRLAREQEAAQAAAPEAPAAT